ncbi:MAG TPA: CopG family transcriptional regulator [Thermoanaerobaculia bacterium]
MKTLEIRVADDVASRLERAAAEKGVSLDELVRLSVEEKLARDEQLALATGYVLAKNAELYERLS